MKKIVGIIYKRDGKYEYTNAEDFIEAIEYQLEYVIYGIWFSIEVFDEELRKKVNEIIANQFGY